MPQNIPQKACKYCKTAIPRTAKVCPQCGRKKEGILKWIILGFLVLCIIGAVAGGGDSEKESSAKNTSDSKTESAKNKSDTDNKEEATKAETKPVEEQESADEGDLEPTKNGNRQ